MSKRHWLGLSVGVLLSGAAFTGNAIAADGATAAPSGAVTGAMVTGTISGGLTWEASPSAEASTTRTTVACYTVPDETCYLHFIADVGSTIAQASFAESPAKSVINTCQVPYVSCAFTDQAIPYGTTNFVVDWYVSGPGVRNVEAF